MGLFEQTAVIYFGYSEKHGWRESYYYRVIRCAIIPLFIDLANAATILTVVAAVLFGGREAKIRTLLSFLRADRMGKLQNIRPGL